MKYLVTSYNTPDLDAVSSMYAYSEYLNKTGKGTDYYISETPKKEVEIVCDMFDIRLQGKGKIKDEKVVIVDTNNPSDIPKEVNVEDVVEIIDHHIKSEDIVKFSNASIQIEMIGAVATLITEKFKENNVPISRNSAILLYYGIISNSINLRARVTDKKDIEMANWLKEQCNEIQENKIKLIFEKKSEIQDNLREELEADLKIQFKDKSVTIAQLEVVDAREFLDNNLTEIKNILTIIKNEKQLDYIFLNCIDIWKGYNIILTIDTNTEKLLEDVLNINFNNNTATINSIILRKEIIKLLKDKV